VAPPVFKTGLAGIALAGGFDSLPPPAPVFGLFFIVASSVGLAAVLISFGLAMVYAGRFMSRFGGHGRLTQRWLPLASFAYYGSGITIAPQSLITAGILHFGA
jgi:ABC-type nickel/cobalt efflux system permease component RcnA